MCDGNHQIAGGKNPLRIICDTNLRTPLSSQIVKSACDVPTIIATCCIDKEKAKIIENKIDLNWTDFLWNFRNNDGLTDALFLNYFKYICDVICYEEKHSPQNRSYDDFDLINEYFGENNPNRKQHLEFFEKAFDCWSQFGDNVKANLFDKFIS